MYLIEESCFSPDFQCCDPGRNISNTKVQLGSLHYVENFESNHCVFIFNNSFFSLNSLYPCFRQPEPTISEKEKLTKLFKTKHLFPMLEFKMHGRGSRQKNKLEDWQDHMIIWEYFSWLDSILVMQSNLERNSIRCCLRSLCTFRTYPNDSLNPGEF